MRLLQRTTRALHLTADGEAFYEQARRIVGEIAALEAELTDRRGTPQGLLRITTSLAFSTHQLAPVIGEFLERYPDVQLELVPTDRVVDLVEEGIDLAIRVGRLGDSSFMARKIGEDVRLVCASPAYLARQGTPQRPEDLARHNCIVTRDRPHTIAGRSASTAPVDGKSAKSKSGAASPSPMATGQLRLALQGLGIVRLTGSRWQARIRSGELVSLLKSSPPRSRCPSTWSIRIAATLHPR